MMTSGFVAALWQSGNIDLILALAANQELADQAARLFDDVQSLSDQLDRAVSA